MARQSLTIWLLKELKHAVVLEADLTNIAGLPYSTFRRSYGFFTDAIIKEALWDCSKSKE
jgi:hypothetical protein